MFGVWFVLAACSGKDDTGAGGGVMVSGTVSSPDGSSANVAIQKAFGFALDGTGLLYAASGAGATCAEVATYLDTDTVEYDPTPLWPGGTCNLFLRFAYDAAAGYDGLELSGEDSLNPWVISCAMDDGVWEYGESNGFTDFFYSGRYYQGTARDGGASFTGVEPDMSVAVDFSTFDGSFTYEEMQAVTITGAVSGTLQVEWCTDLGSTGLL